MGTVEVPVEVVDFNDCVRGARTDNNPKQVDLVVPGEVWVYDPRVHEWVQELPHGSQEVSTVEVFGWDCHPDSEC